MIKYSKQKITFMVLAISAALWTSLAQSAPIYYTEQFVFGFDASYNFANIITPVHSSGSSSTSSSISGNSVFNGLDSSNNNATATAQYISDTASLSGGVLKSNSFLSLSDGFFNIDNAPLDGPAHIGVLSRAGYSDSISVTGSPIETIFGLQVELQLDGNLSRHSSNPGNPGLSNPSVSLNNANGTVWSYGFNSSETAPASIDQTIYLLFPVVEGIAEVNFDLVTEVYILPRGFSGGSVPSYLDMGSDFFNTLSITGIAGLDEQGNPVDLISATSSDGFQFDTVRVDQPPISVSEPAISFLLVPGLLGLGFARRRMRS